MTNPTGAERINLLALVGFIAAFIVPVAAIPLCIIARRQIGITHEGGNGLALAGLIVGIAATLFQVIFFIVWASLFFGMALPHLR